MSNKRVAIRCMLLAVAAGVACLSSFAQSGFDYEPCRSTTLIPIEVDGKVGFIDVNGNPVVKPKFTTNSDYAAFHEGLARLYLDDEAVFIDSRGKVVLRPNVKEAENFSEGMAAVRVGNKWGFIDKRGRMVIAPQFEEVSSFVDGLAAVLLQDRWNFIDKNGRKILSKARESDISKLLSYAPDFSEGLAPLVGGSRAGRGIFGYLNEKGLWAIDPKFDWADEFRMGLAAVQIGHLWGYIDKKGEFRIDLAYAKAGPFSEGLAPVRSATTGKVFFIDLSGKPRTAERFEEAGAFCEGLAAIQLNGSWGYVNSSGEIIIPPQFEEAFGFSGGLASVSIMDPSSGMSHKAYIDKLGKVVWSSKKESSPIEF